jgi:uncharacterized protein (UPF0212 family)
MSLTNFNFLDKEAALYKSAKEQMEENSDFIQTSIENNTKKEKEAVEDAITALNKKLDKIMEHDEIKKAQDNIKCAGEQMSTSVDVAVKAYFNIKKKIMGMDMPDEKKSEYNKKIYTKIIGKFLTEEEIKMFERMVSRGPMMIVPGGTIGRNNNMFLN